MSHKLETNVSMENIIKEKLKSCGLESSDPKMLVTGDFNSIVGQFNKLTKQILKFVKKDKLTQSLPYTLNYCIQEGDYDFAALSTCHQLEKGSVSLVIGFGSKKDIDKFDPKNPFDTFTSINVFLSVPTSSLMNSPFSLILSIYETIVYEALLTMSHIEPVKDEGVYA